MSELKECFFRKDIQEVLQENSNQFQYMFEFFIKKEYKRIEDDINESLKRMKLEEWMKLTTNLDLVPNFLTREDNMAIFRQITIEKDFEPGTKPFLTYDEFL